MSSLIPGYNYDIFISYRQKDNKYDGWVTEFVENLKRELDSMFKDEINVYFDINPSDYLLESYDVDASLKDKLKCLIFIPVISRTYCDPKAFAWDNELKAFVRLAGEDRFGFKIKLHGGNVANRVLPVRIHDLDQEDIKMFESVVGGVMRSIDFVYKETGVNRQLRARDDDMTRSPGQLLYRDQINKVALAIREIIESMKHASPADNAGQGESGAKADDSRGKVVPVNVTEETTGEKIPEPRKKVIPGKRIKVRKTQSAFSRKTLIFGAVIILALAVLTKLVLVFNHNSKVRWATDVALPRMEQLADEFKMDEAYALSEQAGKYISSNERYKELLQTFTNEITIITDPAGADVRIRDYSDTSSAWRDLGRTPVEHLRVPKHGYFLMKISNPGYEGCTGVMPSRIDTVYRRLFRPGEIPSDMVYIYGYGNELASNYLKEKNGFFIDRYEVTNRQYKDFVDKGGYSNPAFWKNPFIKDGKTISWEKAMALLTDKTGQPGPSTWVAGDYPDGQDDFPVSGVSWYEAAAYADYAGKELPTSVHWGSAAGFSLEAFGNYFYAKLLPFSNFKGKGPEPVGANPGINCFGASDMAGNVREWCMNSTPEGHVIRGGGWDDVVYMYQNISQLPSFDRSPKNGFRCVRYTDREKIPQAAFEPVQKGKVRDFYKEKPVDEKVFRIFKSRFMYDKSDLNATIEKRDSSFQDWILEKISFNAAYDNERMLAYLYLPKNSAPPYQTLIFFPGSNAADRYDFNDNYWANWFTGFILKSGRAVMFPVYKGTFERKSDRTPIIYQGYQYADWLGKWVKDFSRSVDYLETRPDIDFRKLGYYGHSWGARLGAIIPAVEDRLKVSILVVGGLHQGVQVPEADEFNYLPYVRIPVLMLNGKYDMTFPYESEVKPFFDYLGTPAKDKYLHIYEADHYIPRNEMIKEILAFLNKYFGPVK